jgi:hypothetical protein
MPRVRAGFAWSDTSAHWAESALKRLPCEIRVHFAFAQESSMSLFGCCRNPRTASKSIAAALLAARAVALCCLAVPVGIAAQADVQDRYRYQGTTKMPLSRQPNLSMEADRPAPERNIERVMSEALSPPRQRCAALSAAIGQAVMDKRGSRALAPDVNARRYPGSSNQTPGMNDGGWRDKQARLEAEYSNLGCMRLAP